MTFKNSKNSIEINENIHFKKKNKKKIKVFKISFNNNFRKLSSNVMNVVVIVVNKIFKILYFVQNFHSKINDIENIYDFNIRQQIRIDQFEITLIDFVFRKNQKMTKF